MAENRGNLVGGFFLVDESRFSWKMLIFFLEEWNKRVESLWKYLDIFLVC